MLKRIEFGELRIGDIARKHIQDCIDNNWISMGPKVALLEQKFAQIMQTKYAVAMCSGTAALTAMTLALPEIAPKPVIRGKSKVLCPALGFIANSTAIVSGGLIPKWVDVRPDNLNIDDSKVKAAIDDDVVAIYSIGTMGQPADNPALSRIANENDLILFEDACENYGSKRNGYMSHKCCIGGCASMFTAHLIQSGEMGMLYLDDDRLYELILSIRSHGRSGNSAYFDHIRFGSNFKTTDLCASIGLEGVEQFYQNIAERKKIWQDLVNFSNKYHMHAWFSHEEFNTEAMPHGFSITIKPASKFNINNLKKIFDKYNIHWKRNFGFCGHHPALAAYNDGRRFPHAVWCGNNGIHIGTHRFMTEENVDRIKTAIGEFFD